MAAIRTCTAWLGTSIFDDSQEGQEQVTVPTVPSPLFQNAPGQALG